MKEEETSRLARLIGTEAVRRLADSRVAVFGVGGVGGYVCEALVRSGVGHLAIWDHDVVTPSNLNRQILALHSTIGRAKTDVMRERLLDINPNLDLAVYPVFYDETNADTFDLSAYDYIADAIDSVPSKTELICRAVTAGTPILSSMGTGNRIDPASLTVTDLSKTAYCPLARTMRRRLRARGIEHLPVVCSREMPLAVLEPAVQDDHTPGSTAFVPPAAGLLIASVIVRALIRGDD